MEMTREAAINALEHLIMSPVGREEIDETCYEVMKYLAAQEPRVMTLEDVKELHPHGDVYIERISSITGVHYIYAATIWRVVSKSIWLCPDNATLWFSEYGETWRCWTSRPTDEQREATPWTQTNGLS